MVSVPARWPVLVTGAVSVHRFFPTSFDALETTESSPVPTVKVATNTPLAEKKKNWIDFNAGPIIDGEDLDDKFFDFVISVAEGRETKNEISGYREISIFKDGVTL